MLFHSATFAAFFLIVFVTHRSLRSEAHRRGLLLVASYVFYGAWNPYYTLLILGSTAVDFVAARHIATSTDKKNRKLLLTCSLSVNLLLLGIFKYYNFFAESVAQFISLNLPFHELLLPVGISFYTFQSMSYTIDVYRGQLQPAKHFVDFALFVAFFPQLVAGPIVRAVEFLPQLEQPRKILPQHIRYGAQRFFIGLLKKIVLADNLALFVDRVHANPLAYSAGDLWVASFAFTLQVYFDFAGYSDMAIGLAKIFGFDFPENFRRPFVARNISEMWRRWHITLSTYLRDYLYIPLGGSRRGLWLNLRNVAITMVLGGLWHGAAWTFVLWGGMHGVYLAAHRLYQHICKRSQRLTAWGETRWAHVAYSFMTFQFWTLSLVVFRSLDMATAGAVLQRMLDPRQDFQTTAAGTLLLCVLCYLGQWVEEHWRVLERFAEWPFQLRVAALAAAGWIILIFKPIDPAPFFYFQF